MKLNQRLILVLKEFSTFNLKIYFILNFGKIVMLYEFDCRQSLYLVTVICLMQKKTVTVEQGTVVRC